MKVYAKSLFVGLCAAALVIWVSWTTGSIPRVIHIAPLPVTQSAVAPSNDYVSVLTVEKTDVTVTTVPWYVSGLALVALLAVSGWQLRRSRRIPASR